MVERIRDMDNEFLIVLAGSFVVSFILNLLSYMMAFSHKRKMLKKKFTWKQFIVFKWKQFTVVTLVTTIVVVAMFFIFVKIGLLGIIVIIGLPGALISFLRKG